MNSTSEFKDFSNQIEDSLSDGVTNNVTSTKLIKFLQDIKN